VHIVGATAYALAGILQFVPRFRARHLAWHRRAVRRASQHPRSTPAGAPS